ncbi:hypothetical protein ABIE67_000216 [Streptomyces sp. V4I8]
MSDFESFTNEENLSPEDDIRAHYAADLAARSQATPWPPAQD